MSDVLNSKLEQSLQFIGTHPFAVSYCILPPNGSLALLLDLNVFCIFPVLRSTEISSNMTVPDGKGVILTATSFP